MKIAPVPVPRAIFNFGFGGRAGDVFFFGREQETFGLRVVEVLGRYTDRLAVFIALTAPVPSRLESLALLLLLNICLSMGCVDAPGGYYTFDISAYPA
jgi:hypothetical protein